MRRKAKADKQQSLLDLLLLFIVVTQVTLLGFDSRRGHVTKKTNAPIKPAVGETWVGNFNHSKVVIDEVIEREPTRNGDDDKVFYHYVGGRRGSLGAGVFTHYFRRIET